MSVVIGVSSVVRAFDASCVGSKVLDPQKFIDVIATIIETFPFDAQPHPGQGFVAADAALPYVSPGVGPRSQNADDFVLWSWRGRVDAFLKRKFAPPAETCNLIVYTIDAYERDPQVERDEIEKLRAEGATHVLVAVLAGAGPKNMPILPHRLVANLAGGNNEALKWSADEIRTKARAAIEYDNNWCVVADDPITKNPKRKNHGLSVPFCGSCGLGVDECCCVRQPDTCDFCGCDLPVEQVLVGVCGDCLTDAQTQVGAVKRLNPNLRIRASNLQAALAAIRAAGFAAEEAAPQGGHVSFTHGPMAGIRTSASGKQAHKILVDSGIVQCDRRGHGHKTGGVARRASANPRRV